MPDLFTSVFPMFYISVSSSVPLKMQLLLLMRCHARVESRCDQSVILCDSHIVNELRKGSYVRMSVFIYTRINENLIEE